MKREQEKQTLDRKVITVSEAAAALSLAPATVRKAIRNGAIEAIVVNGRYRIPLGAIDEFIAMHRVNHGSSEFDLTHCFPET